MNRREFLNRFGIGVGATVAVIKSTDEVVHSQIIDMPEPVLTTETQEFVISRLY